MADKSVLSLAVPEREVHLGVEKEYYRSVRYPCAGSTLTRLGYRVYDVLYAYGKVDSTVPGGYFL